MIEIITNIESIENHIKPNLINKIVYFQSEEEKLAELQHRKELEAMRLWVSGHGQEVACRVWGDGDLSLQPTGKGIFSHTFFNDGRFGFILNRDNVEIAIVGFNINDYLKIFEVVQLQGAKGANRLPRRWERGLLGFVEMYAKWRNEHDGDTESIEVIPAAELHWVKNGRLDINAAKLRYDVTAQRMGYRLNPDTGVYEKKLRTA